MRLKYILKNNPLSIIFFVLFIICFIVMIGISPKIGIILFSAFIVFVIMWIMWMMKSYNHTVNAMKALQKHFKHGAKESDGLSSSPFPVIVCNSNGDINWMSDSFSEIAHNFESFTGYNVSELLNEPFTQEYSTTYTAEAGGKRYTVYPFRLDDNYSGIFFCDHTDYKNTVDKYLRTRPVILILQIESLDTTEESVGHINYSSTLSDIEEAVQRWLVTYNCTFRRYSEGKMIAVTEYSNYLKMKADHFSVFEKVKEQNEQFLNGEISLSIGIGKGESFKESEDFARETIELARGRGGDQAAARIDSEYFYFGGKTSKAERKNISQIRMLSGKLSDLIKEHDSVYIMGHVMSDFDAIGAAIGVSAICHKYQKPTYLICNETNTLAKPLLDFARSNDFSCPIIGEKDFSDLNSKPLLIVCDTMRTELAESKDLLNRITDIVVIDHHKKQPVNNISSYFSIHDPNASSACEIVSELIQYSTEKITITNVEATALLAGIILDTKNFALRTGSRTFEAAAFLRSRKADTVAARKMFATSNSLNAEIISVISASRIIGCNAISVYDKAEHNARLICSKAADEMLNIENIDASYVIWCSDGTSYISARSYNTVNVQLIMEALGGGGHSTMAACRLKDTTADKAYEMLVSAINEYNENP